VRPDGDVAGAQEDHHITIYAIPEPKPTITIRDEGSMIDLTVAPSAR
jgi:hypothetical protein